MREYVSDGIMRRFIAGCRRAAGYGLMRCSSGNISWRVGDDLLLIKSSRAWLSDLTPDGVSVCRISDGVTLGKRKPSVEIRFHAGILRTRPDVNVVMHFQTPFAATVACRRRRMPNFFVIPEIPYYIGDIVAVPYHAPGTQDLAAAVTGGMKDHDMVIMRNHGQVTVGKDFNHVIQNAVFFELACEIIVRNGGRAQPLSADAVRQLTMA